VEDMGILKLSLYLTVMLGMGAYFKKQVDAKKRKSPVPLKTTKGIMK
jgi:hypothetical protein